MATVFLHCTNHTISIPRTSCIYFYLKSINLTTLVNPSLRPAVVPLNLLTRNISFEALNRGQITLSTQLIKPNYFFYSSTAAAPQFLYWETYPLYSLGRLFDNEANANFFELHVKLGSIQIPGSLRTVTILTFCSFWIFTGTRWNARTSRTSGPTRRKG